MYRCQYRPDRDTRVRHGPPDIVDRSRSRSSNRNRARRPATPIWGREDDDVDDASSSASPLQMGQMRMHLDLAESTRAGGVDDVTGRQIDDRSLMLFGRPAQCDALAEVALALVENSLMSTTIHPPAHVALRLVQVVPVLLAIFGDLVRRQVGLGDVFLVTVHGDEPPSMRSPT